MLMPRRTAPTLTWSAARQVYELSAGQRREPLHLAIEGPAWFAWLNAVSSFAFHGQRGSYTARKETKQRRAVYWYAYRNTKGKLAKKYLGKTADLTLARLEDVAGLLQAERATAARTPAPALAPLAPHAPALPLVTADAGAVDAPLALTPHAPCITYGNPLTPLLATKLHRPRSRAQLVPRSQLPPHALATLLIRSS